MDLDDDQLSPEDFNMLLTLGIMPDKNKNLADQLAEAQSLRSDAMQGPGMRGNNRVQTAANPLEFLAKGIQGYRANKDIKSLQGKQDTLLGEQDSARKMFGQKYLASMLRKKPSMIQDIPFDENSVQAPNIPQL